MGGIDRARLPPRAEDTAQSWPGEELEFSRAYQHELEAADGEGFDFNLSELRQAVKSLLTQLTVKAEESGELVDSEHVRGRNLQPRRVDSLQVSQQQGLVSEEFTIRQARTYQASPFYAM